MQYDTWWYCLGFISRSLHKMCIPSTGESTPPPSPQTLTTNPPHKSSARHVCHCGPQTPKKRLPPHPRMTQPPPPGLPNPQYPNPYLMEPMPSIFALIGNPTAPTLPPPLNPPLPPTSPTPVPQVWANTAPLHSPLNTTATPPPPPDYEHNIPPTPPPQSLPHGTSARHVG